MEVQGVARILLISFFCGIFLWDLGVMLLAKDPNYTISWALYSISCRTSYYSFRLRSFVRTCFLASLSDHEKYMTRVGVVGYGTIGKRVADAVLLQDDMELVGVTLHSLQLQDEHPLSRKGILYCTNQEHAVFCLIRSVDVSCRLHTQGSWALSNKETVFLPRALRLYFKVAKSPTVGNKFCIPVQLQRG